MSDEWTVEDDAAAAMEGMGLDQPIVCAHVFLSAFDGETGVVPHGAVTPESLESWGDFSEARAALDAVEDRGVASYPIIPPDAPDVAYVKILRGVTETYRVDSDRVVPVALFVSMVWRPERGFWMTHALGPDMVPPEQMPRTSPGEAPRAVTA